MTRQQNPLLITMGDPAGIGPEIIAKAFRDSPSLTQGCVVAGDVSAMRRAAQAVGGLLPLAVLASPVSLQPVPTRCVPVWQACEPLDAGDALLPAWGQVNSVAGRAAAQCIATAAGLALNGDASAMVTAPIHKEALSAAGIQHPGHTEFLQALAAAHRGCLATELPVRMMLANPELKTVLVSIHVSLRQALDAVTFDNVLQTLRIVQASLGPAGGLNGRRLRIAVAGLNPHAGEGGLFGREEIDVIVPAVLQACSEGMDANGPFAPDTVFMRARTGEFDVVVAMYHDQGLIPVKYLGVDHGVNVTLGLPFVRTSPDHGTAFDVAGTGRADPSSLLAAIRWARAAISD
jgi:4-hydroxythreonine-4-phosphate dehydrogenase